jgi:hypothetical protein
MPDDSVVCEGATSKRKGHFWSWQDGLVLLAIGSVSAPCDGTKVHSNSRIQFASNEFKLVPRKLDPGHSSKVDLRVKIWIEELQIVSILLTLSIFVMLGCNWSSIQWMSQTHQGEFNGHEEQEYVDVQMCRQFGHEDSPRSPYSLILPLVWICQVLFIIQALWNSLQRW